MGRPPLDIDGDKVEALARIHCTYMEIAAVLKCSDDTLKRRFADRIEKGREVGKSSLRRAQFTKALAGNPTMLIWLGKQHLEQQDRHEVAHAGADGGPLTVNVTHRVVAVASAASRLTEADVAALTNGDGNGNGNHS